MSDGNLYHHSPKTNRQSILKSGLLICFDRTGDESSYKAIYLTDKPCFSGSDIWKVDITGLSLESDYGDDVETYGNWFMVFEDIPPPRLVLLTRS